MRTSYLVQLLYYNCNIGTVTQDEKIVPDVQDVLDYISEYKENLTNTQVHAIKDLHNWEDKLFDISLGDGFTIRIECQTLHDEYEKYLEVLHDGTLLCIDVDGTPFIRAHPHSKDEVTIQLTREDIERMMAFGTNIRERELE